MSQKFELSLCSILSYAYIVDVISFSITGMVGTEVELVLRDENLLIMNGSPAMLDVLRISVPT